MDRVDTEGIFVTVYDGKVVLSGEVSSSASQARARLLALEVPGVRDVQEQLEVAELPISLSERASNALDLEWPNFLN